MPKHLHPNPTQKQTGKKCRLFGKDFSSMSEAARYYNISHTWVRQMVKNGYNQDVPREAVRKTWREGAPNAPV